MNSKKLSNILIKNLNKLSFKVEIRGRACKY